MLEVYQNQGFEHAPAVYTILGLEFIGTCGSFPEQYDVVWTDNGVRYQVGYARLRGGYFAVYFPIQSIGSEFRCPIYDYKFRHGNQGSFDDENVRRVHLHIAASRIKHALNARRKFAVTTRRFSDITSKEMVFAGFSEDAAIFYASFSTVGKTWPAQVKIADRTYQFSMQEVLDLNESGVFAGKASYLPI